MVGDISFIFLVNTESTIVRISNKYLGGLGILWSIVWLIFSSDTPATNKHISANEKEYIRVCKIDEKLQDTNTVKIK